MLRKRGSGRIWGCSYPLKGMRWQVHKRSSLGSIGALQHIFALWTHFQSSLLVFMMVASHVSNLSARKKSETTPMWYDLTFRGTLFMSSLTPTPAFWKYCVSASHSFLNTAGHFHQANLSSATVTSPLAVYFRGFMARQSPHIIYRQAGRLVGLQRQWGEPVQSHKWEEAGVIDWVLVPGIEKKTWKRVRCLKVRAYTEVLCWGGGPT